MRFTLLGIGIVAFLSMGAVNNGCAGPVASSTLVDEAQDAGPGPQGCSVDSCPLACPHGFVIDDDGCELCECAPLQTVATACLETSECAENEVCDLENFCDAPPGCDSSGPCDTVCYGRCIDSTPVTDAELCTETNGRWDTGSCGHYACGKMPACRAVIPGCDCGKDANFVEVQGCVADAACSGGCKDNDDCDEGQICLAPPGAPCFGDSECNPRPSGVCVADTSCSDVMCELYCENGFKTDESGCAICSCNEPMCLCPELEIDEPVCGADGETYPSACQAGCAEVEVVRAGECNACNIECIVPDLVCGADGVTYTCGVADAECNGTTVVHEGACKPDCDIQCFVEDPVCGADGVTYACGKGEAECNGTTVAHDGPCDVCSTADCL